MAAGLSIFIAGLSTTKFKTRSFHGVLKLFLRVNRLRFLFERLSMTLEGFVLPGLEFLE